MMKTIYGFILVVGTIGSAPALAIDEVELATLLEETRVEMKTPGLRAAVRFADGRVVRASTGLADVEADVPLDDTIGMPGGSTGKTFAASLTMLLVEDGKLSLDDPVSDWLGDTDWYPKLKNADEIRVRHLLSHSSGIADYPDTVRFNMSMVWRALRHGSARYEPEELINFVLDKRPAFPVGQGFQYTDAGYLVLGRVIEAASERSYYDLLQERILDPHRLDGVRPQNQSVLQDIATGYTGRARNLKKDGRMKFDPSSEWTGGGLVTNPTMLVEFYAALANGRIVSRDSLDLMLDGEWQDPGTPYFRYGFGLFVYDDGARFGHGGRWPGYRTQVIHDTATGTTIAVQANRDNRVDMGAIIKRIDARLE